jgi:[protein-PII] uridylyltransferase
MPVSQLAANDLVFDPATLRVELTEVFRKHDDQPSDARPAILARLTALVADAHTDAERRLNADGGGRACAARLSRFQDALINLIYDYTVAHVYRPLNPADPDQISVVATGGYGRGLLSRGSDLDLLFLLPAKQTAWGESVVEYMLYMLWDLRFKVGHATRTTDQCIKLANADMTIRTALLDARLIFGDQDLFNGLSRRFATDVVAGTARAFIDAKLAERDERHKRTGESRYKVEPNVKDGKGGLRDLHTLHWLAKYLHGESPGKDGAVSRVFSAEEMATFRSSEDFLWTIRCHLHFLTGRAEERLTFDLQPQLAKRLNYQDRRGLRAVERFMRHYFLVAKDVGDLTAALCASLEVQQLKASPSVASLLNPLNWRTRRRIRTRTEFRIENGRLTVTDAEVFQRDPVNMIRFFREAEETKAFLHPDAARLIRASLRLIDDKVRNDPEANRIFLDLLTSKNDAEDALRRMNEAGVLGRFVPEFGKVVSMMQYNMYHHYTVDEHLLRTVGELSKIEHGAISDALPLSTAIIKNIQSRRVLFVAAFLHDIAKGMDGDHSILGAVVARRVCPRFGLTAAETDTVAWLIEQHLTMSNTAQSRDLSDPKTIRAVADIVQSPERLKLLLLLTVADIRAVGPGTWNGWKGQLLRTLYYETEPLVAGGHTVVAARERAQSAQEEFRKALTVAAPQVSADAFAARAYPDYWLRTETKKQVAHAQLLAAMNTAKKTLVVDVHADAFTAVTELTVLAPNHPRLLALFAGACAAAGANIVGAHISTTRDGTAIDTFLLQRAFELDADEVRRGERIGDMIGKLLKGEQWPARLLSRTAPVRTGTASFDVPPEALVDNTLSDQFTVIEVAGLDRPGLLYELTSAISDLNLDITSAHITTFGEKAVDVFYVTDLTNKKIESPSRIALIRDRLVQALSGQALSGQALSGQVLSGHVSGIDSGATAPQSVQAQTKQISTAPVTARPSQPT